MEECLRVLNTYDDLIFYFFKLPFCSVAAYANFFSVVCSVFVFQREESTVQQLKI